jgi:tetratricopeptide (TPR) repeat protein
MLSAALIIVLLAVAGSLASWLLGQWSSRGRPRTTTLVLAGSAALLLTGTAAVTILVATRGWKPFVPVVDSPRSDIVGSLRPSPRAEPAAPVADAGNDLEQQLASLREKAQTSFRFGLYDQAIEFAEQFMKLELNDADMRALYARSLFMVDRMQDARREIDAAMALTLAAGKEVPASWLLVSRSLAEREEIYEELLDAQPKHGGVLASVSDPRHAITADDSSGPVDTSFASPSASNDWPATDCMKSMRVVEASRWFVDNECQRVVGVVFASCRQSQAACNQNALESTGWTYEPAGIVMTSMTQRPVRHRLGSRGPLMASTYSVEESGGMRRQIRYLACFVTAPQALDLLDAASQAESDEALQVQLTRALRSDECYSRVLDWSRAGLRDGRSPDALLRTGVN